MRDLAPVILFVYNRPWHTRQTLEALKQSELAKDSLLYIFSDAPKGNAGKKELGKVKEVRSLLREEQWCGEVRIIERDKNLGLANSIITGVSEIIGKHEKVIVLEDDILTGKYFLKFMNEALQMYSDEERVFGVSGYKFATAGEVKDSTYFLPIMSSWGYATWADKWNKICFEGTELLEKTNSKNLKKQLNFGDLNYYNMLLDQVSGKNDSWAIRFYTSMFLNNGVFLYPNRSLLKNIGFDNTGIHSGTAPSAHYKYERNINHQIELEKKKVQLNDGIINKTKRGTFGISSMQENKMIRNFRKILPPELIQFIRRKRNKGFRKENQELPIPRFTKINVNIEDHEIEVPDLPSFKFMHKEIFNKEIYKFHTGKKKPYIIDGGANIGLSIIYFKKLYPDSEIIAFEPDPVIFKILEKNLKKFNYQNLELINKGLWNEEKELDFWSEGADGGLLSEIDNSNKASTKVETTSLKIFLNQEVDFLKLDIEGAETIVLRAIQQDLNKVKRIFVEYHSFINQPQSIDEILGILNKAGFRLHINSPGNSSTSPFVKLNTYNNMDMQLNIYGFKEE